MTKTPLIPSGNLTRLLALNKRTGCYVSVSIRECSNSASRVRVELGFALGVVGPLSTVMIGFDPGAARRGAARRTASECAHF